MLIYNGEDSQAVALVEWWLVLKKTRDLERVFKATKLLDWLRLFDPPSDFLFDADERGIWIGALFSEWNGGVNLAFWVRENRRTSKKMLKWWEELHTNVLDTYPFISITSATDSVVEQAVRLGYTEVGPMPPGAHRMAVMDREIWYERRQKNNKSITDSAKRAAVAAG